MKKTIAILIALVILLAAVPVFACGGHGWAGHGGHGGHAGGWHHHHDGTGGDPTPTPNPNPPPKDIHPVGQ